MAAALVTAPVATDYTCAFVRENLPDGGRDVLEIGCGTGEVAARLARDGLRVVALDTDPERVAVARAAGVDARAARWPIPLDEQFDAVLFTRSLHHIHDLERAVAAAAAALRPRGRIIVEDLRTEGSTERSAIWFAGLTELLFAAGALVDSFDLAHTLAKLDLGEHEHELHRSDAIAAELGRTHRVVAQDSAYYFRYLEAELRFGPAACRALLDHELSLVAAGCIDPLGRRFVASA